MNSDRFSVRPILTSLSSRPESAETPAPIFSSGVELPRGRRKPTGIAGSGLWFNDLSRLLSNLAPVYSVQFPFLLLCRVVVKVSPEQRQFWERAVLPRTRKHGFWFGWDATLEYLPNGTLHLDGRFCIDGQLFVSGDVGLLPHITSADVRAVKQDLQLFVTSIGRIIEQQEEN